MSGMLIQHTYLQVWAGFGNLIRNGVNMLCGILSVGEGCVDSYGSLRFLHLKVWRKYRL
jgi:hypothetical protein